MFVYGVWRHLWGHVVGGKLFEFWIVKHARKAFLNFEFELLTLLTVVIMLCVCVCVVMAIYNIRPCHRRAGMLIVLSGFTSWWNRMAWWDWTDSSAKCFSLIDDWWCCYSLFLTVFQWSKVTKRENLWILNVGMGSGSKNSGLMVLGCVVLCFSVVELVSLVKLQLIFD